MFNQTKLDTFGVSDHAVAQFKNRIARLDDARARSVIHGGLRSANNIYLLPDGNTLRIRTRSPFPFEFRAFCVFDHQRGHFVVTTVVRGDSCVTRKRKHKGTTIKESHGANDSA